MSSQLQSIAVTVDAVHEHRVRVSACGELDLSTAPQLAEVLRHEIDLGRDVLLDLSAVSFIDSSGLHAIISAAHAARSRGRELTLHPVLGAQAQRLLEITKLHHVLLPVGSWPAKPSSRAQA
jgi:anti-anti-sigma factor